MKKLFLLILFLLLIPNSFAHHGGEGISGSGVSGPIITIPAYTLPKKHFVVGVISTYTNYNTFSKKELLNLSKRGEEIHSPSQLFVPSLAFAYGITDDFSVFTSIPYSFRYGIREAHSGGDIHNHGNSIGIGDITLLGQYRFLKKNDRVNLHASILGGLKIPSGVRRNKGIDGSRLEIDSQPGTGSWDPQLGLSLSKSIGKFSLDANGLYILSTEGVQNSTRGDIANFNFSISRGLLKDRHPTSKSFFEHAKRKKITVDVILEANGQWSEKPLVNGRREENDGGTIVYLSPGIRATLDHKWILNYSFGLPIIKGENGRGRAPDYRMLLGVSRAL